MDYIIGWALVIALLACTLMLCVAVAVLASYAIKDIRNNLKR